jgi:hypothetical protein
MDLVDFEDNGISFFLSEKEKALRVSLPKCATKSKAKSVTAVRMNDL